MTSFSSSCFCSGYGAYDDYTFIILGKFSSTRNSRCHKTNPASGDSSLLSSTKRRGGITKSSASKEKRRTGTKANDVIDRTSPSLIASSQADEEGESSESKKDNKKPFDLEYVYKVVQYLDIPGSESQDADKMIFLGTFDHEKEAINRSFEQYKALRLLVEGTTSALEKRLDGMLRLFVNQKNGGKEKKVTIEVQREVRKSRLLGRVYVVLREDRKKVFKLSDKGDLVDMSILGVYPELESAVHCLRKEPQYAYDDWWPEPEEFHKLWDENLLEREEGEGYDGMPFIRVLNPTEHLAVKVSISIEILEL